jgi:hypothetical protein
MEQQFFCPECSCEHDDPADARLGFLILCLQCALVVELETANQATLPAGQLLAA